MKYQRNEPLKKHTSFRIGGPADYFCVPGDVEQLKEALAFAKENRFPVTMIGAGTNLLALDKGFRGMAVKLAGGLNFVKIEGRSVSVGAGVFLPRLLNVLARKGLGGLEFLAGIPGTVGGAVIMNAGAWGKDLGSFIEQVKVLNAKGKEEIICRRDLKFGYRKSLLQNGKHIVTEIILSVKKEKAKTIKKKIKDFLEKRRLGQPLGIPNAGCIFKNPKGKFAGRLLEAAGCKGMRVGDAQVSSKHANFIVNLGDARAQDVLRLMTKMQKKVSGLEPEIKIVVKSQL